LPQARVRVQGEKRSFETELEGTMSGVRVDYDGSRIAIDFAASGLDLKTLPERVMEVLPLLVSLVEADNAWLTLSQEEISHRAKARAAIELMTQAATQNAIQYASLLKATILGEKSVGDYGFPEFADSNVDSQDESQ
jgi:hypothetical protein